jgi:hypothetical protein
VEDHDVAVAKARDAGESNHLVCVHCVFQIDDSDEEVMCNNVCSLCGVTDWYCYVGRVCIIDGTRGIDGASGTDALALSLLVTHLSFFLFRKILVNIFMLMRGQVLCCLIELL